MFEHVNYIFKSVKNNLNCNITFLNYCTETNPFIISILVSVSYLVEK